VTSSHRPWKALRTPVPFGPQPESGVSLTATTRPPPPPEEYDVDLSALDTEWRANSPETVRPIRGQEKSAWDARAKLAMDLSKIGGFSKVDVDDIVAAAERDGMAFTKDRSHIVVFDGHNFTLAKNTLFNRALFGLDSLMRKAGGVQ